MTAFQFKTGRRGGVVQESLTGEFTDTEEDKKEVPGLIQGQIARSLLEWWAARSLWKLKREFIYQYPINGGTQKRGGIVIDFLLIDGPTEIIEMQGDRWHKGQFSSGERLRENIIHNIFGVFPIYIWEHNCPTESDTYQEIKKALYG